MAIQQLDVENNIQRVSLSLTDETSDAILVRNSSEKDSTLSVFPGTGTGKVQFSISKIADIKANADGVNVHWKDWSAGAVAVDTIAPITSVITAIRVVAVGGPVVFEYVNR